MLKLHYTQTLRAMERNKHIDETREAIEVGAIWREAYCAGFADGFKMAEKLIKGGDHAAITGRKTGENA